MVGRRLVMMMILITAFGTEVSMAQQQGTSSGSTTTPPATQSTPPTEQPDMTGQNQGEAESQAPATAMEPASSGISITSGSEGSSISYVLPSFQWTGAGNHSLGSTTHPNSEFHSTYVGSLVLQRVHKQTEINFDYAGGGEFYSNSTNQSKAISQTSYGILHRVGAGYIWNLRKVRLIVNDGFLYLPESPFGFSGFSGLNSFGGGAGASALGNQISVNSTLSPQQNLLTGSGSRYSNSLVGEAQYQLGGRTMITASSSYGIMKFVDPGLINSHYWTSQLGYNYYFNSHSQLAITFVQNLYLYNIHNRGILGRGFELTYQRQITGKLSLKVSGGDLWSEVAQPQGGTLGKPYWITNDSLLYRARTANFSLQYMRFTTPGSGLVPGAETNLTEFSVSRKLLRNLFTTVGGGHSFNQSIVQASSGERQTRAETWQVGVDLSHELNDRTSLFAHYQLQRQTANRALCLGINCGNTFLRDSVGFGVNWHGRPIRIH